MSIVLPCFNEEKCIAQTVEEVNIWMRQQNIHGEVIVVDDGSRDHSGEILNHIQKSHPHLKILHHLRNHGYGAAIRTGCDAASMDIIGYMDSDGQFNVHDFDSFLPQIAEADFVAGIRVARSDSAIRKLNSWLWNTFTRLVLGIRGKDIDCGMKLFRRSIWPQIRPVHANGGLFGAELFYRVEKAHVRFRQEPVQHFSRKYGKPTGARLRVIVRAFLELGRLLRAIVLHTQKHGITRFRLATTALRTK